MKSNLNFLGSAMILHPSIKDYFLEFNFFTKKLSFLFFNMNLSLSLSLFISSIFLHSTFPPLFNSCAQLLKQQLFQQLFVDGGSMMYRIISEYWTNREDKYNCVPSQLTSCAREKYDLLGARTLHASLSLSLCDCLRNLRWGSRC
jgi:hypothetical protein